MPFTLGTSFCLLSSSSVLPRSQYVLPFPKPDSFLADTASVAGDIQLLQDKGSLFQITVFHVGDEYGSRILGFGQILVQMLCIDPFGNAAEHASGLYTSGRISVRTSMETMQLYFGFSDGK